MRIKLFFGRSGCSLLMLALFFGTASSATKDAEPLGVPVTHPCDISCAQEAQPCQAFCALLFNGAAVQPPGLASLRNDYSVIGVAAPTEILNLPSMRKEATDGKLPASYMTAAGEGTRPGGSEMAAPKSAETPQPHWSHLPIWGPEAEAKGYRVPLPFGIGATFYDAKQPVNVRDLKLGIGRGPTESATFVKVGQSIVSWQQNVFSRFDVWLFPFFNLCGVIGYTRGNTRGTCHCYRSCARTFEPGTPAPC